MSLPRLVLTPELLGKTIGKPHDTSNQIRYLKTGLDLLVGAEEGKAFIELENRTRVLP